VELWREVTQKKVIMLIGNKVDLESLRQVSTREAQAWAEENQMTYVECSAKTGRNINEIFVQVAQRLVDANPERSDPDRQNSGSDRESLDLTDYGKKGGEEDGESGRRGRKCCYSG
jgi:GTPase SAR1 family protein